MGQIDFLIYLAGVSLSSFAFFILYVLILKHLTFFKINRIYLLSALLFSFAIPCIKIDTDHRVIDVHNDPEIYHQIEHLSTLSSQPFIGNDQTSLSLAGIIIYIYIFITSALFCRAVHGLFQIVKHTKKKAVEVSGLKVIYKHSGFVNCSFFNYVFINPASFNVEEIKMLLQHEHVHAKQWHSADKIFLLFCKTILWFNPLIYWYDTALEQAHEFEADAITSKTEDPESYARLLIRMGSDKKSHILTHHFGKHPVKARILMLFAARSKAVSATVYLLAIPVFIGLILVFSVKLAAAYPSSGPVFTLILDAGHGGSDEGAAAGDITEKELSLGLVKQIQSLAEAKGISVISTRNDDSNLSLKNRGLAKGDIMLSVHYNTSDNRNKSGIEILSGISANSSRRSVIKNLSLALYQQLSLLDGIATENLSREVTGSYLLDKSVSPAIMLELGYLSNTNDRQFITSPAHQNELSEAIVNSVLAYREAQIQHQ